MKNKTDTKRALIDATKELLKDKSGITVKEISAKAFTNVAAVNYHFGDKDALLTAALREILHTLRTELNEYLDSAEGDSTETLVGVCELLMSFFASYKGAVRYILLTADYENGGKYAEGFFFDNEFVDDVLDKISEVSGEKDRKRLFYKYTIAVSALIVPLVLDGGGDSKLGLSELMRADNRDFFLETLGLLFAQ